MFSELPKLLDRDFGVRFFLPAAAMAGGIWAVLSVFGLTAAMPNAEALTSTAIALFVVWLLSVALLAFHYAILRLLEGYPIRWRRFLKSREKIWKQRFRKKIEPNLVLQENLYRSIDLKSEPPKLPRDFARSLDNNVRGYPDKEEYVLPTRFGNIFRSLEVYSRVVYGLDAIPAWPRLLAVLPEQFKKQLAEANSLLAFFVNLAVSGAAMVVLYLSLAVSAWKLPSPWLPLAAAGISVGAYHAALVQVARYGLHVKSAWPLPWRVG